MAKTILSAALALVLAVPSVSFAFLEVGAGWGLTAFEGDLEGVETGPGLAGELTIGGGQARLMVTAQESEHDPGNAGYKSWGLGPLWRLDLGRADASICALLSNHSFEDVEGWGVTLGGGVGWKILPGARFRIEARLSQWEGDGLDARNGTLLILLAAGF